MRRLCLDDLLRTAEALEEVPSPCQRAQVLLWLEAAHCQDVARKHGVWRGPGDLASALPAGALHRSGRWRGCDGDLARLAQVLAAIGEWRAARHTGK